MLLRTSHPCVKHPSFPCLWTKDRVRTIFTNWTKKNSQRTIDHMCTFSAIFLYVTFNIISPPPQWQLTMCQALCWEPESHLAFITVEHSGDEDEELRFGLAQWKLGSRTPTQSHGDPRSGLLSSASLPFSHKSRQSYPYSVHPCYSFYPQYAFISSTCQILTFPPRYLPHFSCQRD